MHPEQDPQGKNTQATPILGDHMSIGLKGGYTGDYPRNYYGVTKGILAVCNGSYTKPYTQIKLSTTIEAL